MAKRMEYAVSVRRDARTLADGGEELALTPAWTPEHLVLAALARCTLASLAYHAERARLRVRAGAEAAGVVTAREEDGRYAFVEVRCAIDAELDPAPPDEDLARLLARAERGCFVGSSLTAKPRYEWRVNGRRVEAAGS